jgi:hypothetical protein
VREPVCPACGKVLIVLELDGVEVDSCPGCGGSWLDAGEIELLAERAGVRTRTIREALAWRGRGRKGSRRCPRCRRRLEPLSAGVEETVVVDRCRLGHGLWFDRGEIASLVRSLGEGEQRALSEFFARVYRHELGAGGRGDCP